MDFILNLIASLPSLFLRAALWLTILIVIGLCLIVCLCVVIKLWFNFVLKKRPSSNDDGQVKVGFFHPYCDAGGGGERVLWTGVRALGKRFPAAKIIVYTGDVEVMECYATPWRLWRESRILYFFTEPSYPKSLPSLFICRTPLSCRKFSL